MKPVVGKTLLTEIPHQKGNLTFQHPAFRGNYGSVAQQIDVEGLGRPTSPETASLVYDSLRNPKGEYESQVMDILRNNWLLEFTGNLYLPEREGEEVHNGVIIETNPTIENGSLVMDRKALTERLKSNDSNVKFVPFGYDIGEQSTHKLAKNSYILARYGDEGAGKIADLASHYKKNPKLLSFKSVDSEVVRMSAVGDYWYFDGRLLVNGNVWDVGDSGHAFGVKK